MLKQKRSAHAWIGEQVSRIPLHYSSSHRMISCSYCYSFINPAWVVKCIELILRTLDDQFEEICSHVVFAICSYSDICSERLFANRYMHVCQFIHKCMQIINMQIVVCAARSLALFACNAIVHLTWLTKRQKCARWRAQTDWTKINIQIQFKIQNFCINTQSATSTWFFLSTKLNLSREKKN